MPAQWATLDVLWKPRLQHGRPEALKSCSPIRRSLIRRDPATGALQQLDGHRLGVEKAGHCTAHCCSPINAPITTRASRIDYYARPAVPSVSGVEQFA